MNMVIDLLTQKRSELVNTIKFMEEQIASAKMALEELNSQEFLDRNKDNSCLSDDWTIYDYIEANVRSRESSITTCTQCIDELNEYLSQIDTALCLLSTDKTL